jgi:hypothetical protein
MSLQAEGRGKVCIQIADGEKLLEGRVNKNLRKKAASIGGDELT